MIHQFKEIHNDKNTTIQYALSDLSRSFSFRLIVACFLVWFWRSSLRSTNSYARLNCSWAVTERGMQFVFVHFESPTEIKIPPIMLLKTRYTRLDWQVTRVVVIMVVIASHKKGKMTHVIRILRIAYTQKYFLCLCFSMHYESPSTNNDYIIMIICSVWWIHVFNVVEDC